MVWVLNKTKEASLNVLTDSYFDDGITFSVEIDTNKSAFAENRNNRFKYMNYKFKLHCTLSVTYNQLEAYLQLWEVEQIQHILCIMYILK